MAQFKRPTTTDLITNGKYSNAAVGTIIETLGYTTKGDGGKAQWKTTGNTIAASQTPALTVDATCSDAAGNEFKLVLDDSGVVNLVALGAIGDAGTTDNTTVLQAADASDAKLIAVPNDSSGGVFDILSDIRPSTPLLGTGGYITRTGDAGIFYPNSWTDLSGHEGNRTSNTFGSKTIPVAAVNASTSPKDSSYFLPEYSQQVRYEMLNQSGFELYTDGGTGTDGAITTATTTFTSASASFVSGDVGSTIVIAGADPAAADGTALTTTIASFTSSTEVELTDPAAATVSSAYYQYGTDTASGIYQVWLNSTHVGQNDCYNLYHAQSASNIRNITPVSWGYQPSAGFFGGQNNASTNKVNLYGYGDVVLNDNSKEDVSLFGQVFFVYYDGTESGDYRIPRVVGLWKNLGANDIDAVGVFAGPAYVGLDLSDGTFSGAAIALKQSQKISWDTNDTIPSGKFSATDVGTTDTKFDGSSLVDTVASNGIFQRTQSTATVDSDVDSSAIFSIKGLSTTAFITMGQIGTSSYLTANSSGTDSTTLFIRTAASGAEANRMKFAPSGTVEPGADNTQSFGTSGVRWGNNYSTNYRPGDGSVLWTSGSGTPEGAVTANVGSMFTRTDGGASTTLYVKESGTGNTGWVAK
jgi:hypothetical protein